MEDPPLGWHPVRERSICQKVAQIKSGLRGKLRACLSTVSGESIPTAPAAASFPDSYPSFTLLVKTKEQKLSRSSRPSMSDWEC